MVDRVLGRAQKWRRHNWQAASGPARHLDLWTRVPDILEIIASEIQWLDVPSHIGIYGNAKADSLADQGRRRSPLLRGHVSASPTMLVDKEHPPLEVVYQELPEMPVDPLPQPQTPVHMDEPADGTPGLPQTPVRTGGLVDGTPCRPRTQTPTVPDIEVLTPTLGRKHQRIRSPPRSPYTLAPFPRNAPPALFHRTAASEQEPGATQPRVPGPACTTFRSPFPPSPMTPNASRNLLSSLNLVAMNPPPPPWHLGRHPTAQHPRTRRPPTSAIQRFQVRHARPSTGVHRGG